MKSFSLESSACNSLQRGRWSASAIDPRWPFSCDLLYATQTPVPLGQLTLFVRVLIEFCYRAGLVPVCVGPADTCNSVYLEVTRNPTPKITDLRLVPAS
jgi:hypothetical protein